MTMRGLSLPAAMRKLPLATALAAMLAGVLALGGCGLPVAHTEAGLDLPAGWQAPNVAATPNAPNAPDAARVDAAWWRGYGDPELSRLVDQARAGSYDVAAAVARVRQAEASARIAGAPLLPEVEGNFQAERAKQAGYSAYSTYTAALSASYELDLWGGNRAARQSALATLTATEYSRDAVLMTLTAGVANTYLQTLALRERADIARRNLAAGERILAFIDSQYRAGAATALDLSQQRGLVAGLRQAVTLYAQQARESQTALAILAGRPPQGFAVAATTLDALRAPVADAGVPADLLTQRPDLAQAERQLAAADADVTVARAAMLPNVTLTASFGYGNDHLRGLFDHPIHDLAAGLVAPIFNNGRLSGQRDLALARREELLADYRGAIVNALGDVETALNALDGYARQQRDQDEVVAQARETVRLAESHYRAGAETLLTLLDAQRSQYAAEDAAVQLRLARLQASVSLYKALGGGWRQDAPAVQGAR
ncbi:efflux transporter outer membrane subunit [Bordetella genomosp. 10]|nr:efflux transporter outer membrane subunit [Bordetella genomosp. 10]